MGPKRNRRKRHEDRELTRDEVFVPEVYGGYLEEINRGAAYARYLIIRRAIRSSGPVGKVISFAIVGALALVLLRGFADAIRFFWP